jgi:uncharacterized damage-inducible protein DinB
VEQSLVVPSLTVAPHLLRGLCGDATSEQIWAHPTPGEWSIGDVVRHLLAADQRVFVPRLGRMIAEARPTFASIDDVLASGRELGPMLDEYDAERSRLVGLLESLAPEGWLREGVIPRGPVSVASYANVIAEHDIEHRRQIHDLRQALGLKPKRAEAKRPLTLAEVIEAIAAGPERVRRAADGLTAAQMRQRPRAGDWSIKEIMAHLLKVERDLFLPRLTRLASEDRPAFASFDADAWARERDHREGDFQDEWRLFAALRAETVALLRGLPENAAGRIGLSGFFGPVTLGEYATHVADHDVEHLGQIAEARSAIGG